MALLRPSTFIDIKFRYLAAKAGWKVISSELADNWHKGISLQTVKSILKKVTTAYSQYRHNDHATLKPLRPVNDTALEKGEAELLAALCNYRSEVHHIAISGHRSVNKSYLLHRFAQRNRQYHYLFLTLATSKADIEAPDYHDVDQAVIKQLLPPDNTNKKSQLHGHNYFRLIAALTVCSAVATLAYINGVLGMNQSTAVQMLMLYPTTD